MASDPLGIPSSPSAIGASTALGGETLTKQAAALFSPAFFDRPYPSYERMREAGGIERHPFGFVAVTSFDAVSAALRNGAFGHEDSSGLDRRRSILHLDPPDHTRIRRVAAASFTPRRVEQLRPWVRERAAQLADDVANEDSFDFIKAVAHPLPVQVICELIGVPSRDWDQVKAWSRARIATADPISTPTQKQAGERATAAFEGYLKTLAAKRAADPADDLLSDILQRSNDDALTLDEVISTCSLLLTAGHETTVNLAGSMMLLLLQDEDRWREAATEAHLRTAAIYEAARLESPIQLVRRIAHEDAATSGFEVKGGESVVMFLGSANRDPSAFEDADDFRFDRRPSHLAFGAGIHYCLGAQLAIMQLEELFSILLAKDPPRLVSKRMSWRRSLVFRGLDSLPLASTSHGRKR